MATTMLGNQSSTGFYKAPVCKGLIGSMVLTCTAIHVPILAHLRQSLICEIPAVLTSRSIWRILLNRMIFLYPKDIICSALVIYYFRIFERRMGSRKFSSYLFGTCTIATVVEICIILLLKSFDIQYYQSSFLQPGLYALIFPLFVNYFSDIPRINVTHFLGVPVTGKTITYLLGLQVGTTSLATITSSFCGIVAGIIYRANVLHVQKWLVIPGFISKVCDKLLGWLMHSSEPKDKQMGATIELQRQEQAEVWEQQYLYNRVQDFRQVRGQGYAERLIDDQPPQDEGMAGFLFRRRGNNPANSEPSQENIRILVDMGFPQSRAAEALRASSNDLESATSILLRQ